MADYDIRKAFEKIENELIASMIRNMEKHREWEDDEGFQWEQWQALQLKELAAYRKRNKKLFGGEFKKINKHLEEAIRKAREEGNMQQELELLKMVRTGRFKKPKITKGMAETNAEFFKMNDRKMDALIQATVSDMEKAETAILRMANDKYRKVIFDAQVYANSGASTYEKAIDMATRDFLAAGLNCVEYKNGARHTLKDYADMALRTASKRAYLTGEGEKRKEWGISTVIMNKRGNPCPLCLPFVGKVMIDDVWSGGSSKDGNYPLMSAAISKGLYHPRCRDSHSTYFESISTPPDDKFSKDEIKQIEAVNKAETKKRNAQRKAESFERLAAGTLDRQSKSAYAEKSKAWIASSCLIEQEETLIKRDMLHLLPQTSMNVKENLTKELDKLTSEELDVLRRYTGALATNLNMEISLRDKVTKYKDEMDLLDKALAKGIVHDDVVVMRQTIPEFLNTFPKGYRPTPTDMVNLVGKTITNKIFTSTSLEMFSYPLRTVRMSIRIPAGYKGALYLKNIPGNKFGYQEELLFRRGLTYIVEDVKVVDDVYYLEARAINE